MGHVIMLQDSGEPSNGANQASAQPGLSIQFTASANGNGNSQAQFPAVAHQAPIYQFFDAHSSRLYPEWSVPEPVAVPHRSNGFWGSSWSQPQQTQAAPPPALLDPVHLQGPASAGIYDAQTVPHPLQAASLQPVLALEAHTQPGALQLPPAASASAQPPPHSPLHNLVPEPPQHPSTGQVSLTQPSSSAASQHHTPARLPASAEPPQRNMALQSRPAPSAPPASQLRSTHEAPQPLLASEPWSVTEVQQQQQPQVQQLPQDQQQQQQQHQQQLVDQQQQLEQQQIQDMQPRQHPAQQLPQQLPNELSGAPGNMEATNQQTGPRPGPSEEAPAVAAPNVGAYSQRELFLQNLEEAGDMSFEYVLNDGQRHNSIWSVISPSPPCAGTCCFCLLPSYIVLEHLVVLCKLHLKSVYVAFRRLKLFRSCSTPLSSCICQGPS